MSQRSTTQRCHTDTPFCTIRKSHVTSLRTWNFAVPVPHSEEIRRRILLFLCTLGVHVCVFVVVVVDVVVVVVVVFTSLPIFFRFFSSVFFCSVLTVADSCFVVLGR